MNISLTNGATSGMTVALMSAAPPGSTVVTEAIGHHTLVPLATYLASTSRACDRREWTGAGSTGRSLREADIRAVFVQPSVVNPTATLMSEKRRGEIAEVSAKARHCLIENDVLGPWSRTSAAACGLRAGAARST